MASTASPRTSSKTSSSTSSCFSNSSSGAADRSRKRSSSSAVIGSTMSAQPFSGAVGWETTLNPPWDAVRQPPLEQRQDVRLLRFESLQVGGHHPSPLAQGFED